MTEEQRQKLFDKLMENSAEECQHDANVLRELGEFTTRDLEKIEPLIDEMIIEAFREGRKCSNVPQ